MTNLETMQREGREGLKKFEQYEADGYGYTVDGQTEMDDLYKESDQHTANTWKACKDAILESGLLEEYGNLPETPSEFKQQESWANTGHNTAVRAVKEFISNMDKV